MISHDQVWRIAAWKSIHYFHFGENIKRSDISTYKSFSGCISWCSGVKKKKKQSYDNIPSQITASFHIKSYLHKFNMWHLTSGFRGGRKYSKEAASRANSGQNVWIKAAFCTVQHQIHLSFTKVLFDRAIKVDFFLLSNYPYQWPLFHLIFKYWSYCSHSCSITKTQPYTVISMYGYTSTILIPLPINDLDRRVLIMGC